MGSTRARFWCSSTFTFGIDPRPTPVDHHSKFLPSNDEQSIPNLACSKLSDYPDETILGNLHRNVSANQSLVQPACRLNTIGYAWGTDIAPLL